MKFAALILLITAMSAQAQTWPPAVNLKTIAAIPAPAPVSPAKAMPRDGANYSGAEEVLLKEFFVPGISLDIPEKEVAAQMAVFDNAFGPEQALRLALNSFFQDHKDATSPLAGILTDMGTVQPGKAQVKQASDKLLRLMNMSGSQLKLLPAGASAPRGESTAANWVFSLRLGYSGTSYWAVVDRTGVKGVYNYGADQQ